MRAAGDMPWPASQQTPAHLLWHQNPQATLPRIQRTTNISFNTARTPQHTQANNNSAQ